MAKREKPTRPYTSDELKSLLEGIPGETMDKLVDNSYRDEQNIALPERGRVYPSQLSRLIRSYVRSNNIRSLRFYADKIRTGMVACGLEDCIKTLFVKMSDLKAIDYLLGNIDEDFRVGEVTESTLNSKPQKGLFMKTGRCAKYNAGGQNEQA